MFYDYNDILKIMDDLREEADDNVELIEKLEELEYKIDLMDRGNEYNSIINETLE